MTDLSACVTQPLGARTMEYALRAIIVRALRPYRGALRSGESVSLAVVSADEQQDLLFYPEEQQVLAPGACAKKRTELALGRAAVRSALRELGKAPVPVSQGEHGEPLWPEGITGSITHCWPWTAALLVSARKRFAIGIDLENLEQAAVVDITSVICTPSELAWVRGSDSREQLAMIFSAKEAVYKAFHPFCRRYIDFKEVELSWHPKSQSFRVTFLGDLEPKYAGLADCEVLSCRINGLVFSCLVHVVEEK